MLEEIANIRNFLESQRFGVLSTAFDNFPHCSLVALAFSEDLTQIIFVTSKSTKKFRNIVKNPKISMFLDNRKNSPEDVEKTITICAYGNAKIMETKDELPIALKKKYLDRHPYLSDFLHAEKSIIILIEIEKFQVVSNFQDVKEIHIK